LLSPISPLYHQFPLSFICSLVFLLFSPPVLAPAIVYEKFSIVERRAPLKARKFLKETIEVAACDEDNVNAVEEKSSTSFKGLSGGRGKRQKLKCSTLARRSRLFLNLDEIKRVTHSQLT
jgi:ABC-type phosphate transport system ATPase subunit